MPHPHAHLIKMWADDPSIPLEYKNTAMEKWAPVHAQPMWWTHWEYRVRQLENWITWHTVPAIELNKLEFLMDNSTSPPVMKAFRARKT